MPNLQEIAFLGKLFFKIYQENESPELPKRPECRTVIFSSTEAKHTLDPPINFTEVHIEKKDRIYNYTMLYYLS